MTKNRWRRPALQSWHATTGPFLRPPLRTCGCPARRSPPHRRAMPSSTDGSLSDARRIRPPNPTLCARPSKPQATRAAEETATTTRQPKASSTCSSENGLDGEPIEPARGQAGRVRLHRDVLQPEAQACEERDAVTSRFRTAAKHEIRRRLAGLFSR